MAAARLNSSMIPLYCFVCSRKRHSWKEWAHEEEVNAAGNRVVLIPEPCIGKPAGGTWYYRFQINGKRKAVSLKLKDKDKALEAAKKLVPITQSDNAEVIAAHVKVFRKIEKKQAPLSLEKAWELYCKHPERNNPSTVHEQLAIRRIYDEFCRFRRNDRLFRSHPGIWPRTMRCN